MCGIAGAVSFSGEYLGDQVAGMTATLTHRGPDSSGLWTEGHCALGHRRLAIIDLSKDGHQPLCNAKQTLWITFNGEVYNFREIRSELEERGHHFRTKTDTEVIVQAYEEWGVDCLRRLRGMFAFAIWDTIGKRLFLARDRVGKKPLFFARTADKFFFASEIQALLKEPEFDIAVDYAAIDSYLTFGYVPAPRTAFSNIHKLEAAHFMTVDVRPDNLHVQQGRYWSLSYHPKTELSEADACESVREELTEAVRLRLVSDVPVGALLSGGVDSSIVVGLMVKLSSKPVKTFSISFDESAYDEGEHARRIAKLWNTEHHEFTVRPEAMDILPLLVQHYGEPFADSSAIPTFYVSKLTRQSVTVALNGDGGDECFAGYDRYKAMSLAEILQGLPGAARALKVIGNALPGTGNSKDRLYRAKRLLGAMSKARADRYRSWISYFDEQDKARLYTSDFKRHISSSGSEPERWLEGLFAGYSASHAVDASMAVDVQSYLPFDLLVKVDITCMANSLEARSPFLDHKVMELAARLPVRSKLRGVTSKHILLEAFPELLPQQNIRRRKMGFGIPVGQWLRTSMKAFLTDCLLSANPRIYQFLEAKEVKRYVAEHVEGRSDHGFRLWNLLMLELWLQQMVPWQAAQTYAPPSSAGRVLQENRMA